MGNKSKIFMTVFAMVLVFGWARTFGILRPEEYLDFNTLGALFGWLWVLTFILDIFYFDFMEAEK